MQQQQQHGGSSSACGVAGSSLVQHSYMARSKKQGRQLVRLHLKHTQERERKGEVQRCRRRFRSGTASLALPLPAQPLSQRMQVVGAVPSLPQLRQRQAAACGSSMLQQRGERSQPRRASEASNAPPLRRRHKVRPPGDAAGFRNLLLRLRGSGMIDS